MFRLIKICLFTALAIVTLLLLPWGGNDSLTATPEKRPSPEAKLEETLKRNYEVMLGFSEGLIGKDSPFLDSAYMLRGYANHMLGRHKQAIRDLTKALEIKMTSPDIYYFRAESYRALGNLSKAIEDYGRFLDSCPRELTEGTYVGLPLRATLRDVEEKYKVLGEIVRETMPKDVNDLISGLLPKFELEPIKRSTRLAILEGLIFSAYHGRGVTLASLGRFDQALHDLNKALQLNKNDPYIYNTLGGVYRLKGNFSKAIQNYKHAIKLNEKHPVAYYNLGLTYLQCNRPYHSVRFYLMGFVKDKDALQALKSLTFRDIITGLF